MAKVLIVRRRKLILILLIATLVFLLVISANRRESQVNKHKRTITQSKTRVCKPISHVGALEPEPETSKPEEEKLKPEKKLFSSRLGTSQAPHAQVNKPNTCQPKTNNVFIKTIKTGGSTLTNILSRFAVKHNLNIHRHEGVSASRTVVPSVPTAGAAPELFEP